MKQASAKLYHPPSTPPSLAHLARDGHALLIRRPLLAKQSQGLLCSLANSHVEKAAGNHHARSALSGLAVYCHHIFRVSVEKAFHRSAESPNQVQGRRIVVVKREPLDLLKVARLVSALGAQVVYFVVARVAAGEEALDLVHGVPIQSLR